MAKIYDFDKAVLKHEIESLESSILSLVQQYEFLVQTEHEALAQTLKVELDRLEVATSHLKHLAGEHD